MNKDKFAAIKTIKRARKPHLCWECREAINIGESYSRVTVMERKGKFQSKTIHSDCLDALLNYFNSNVPDLSLTLAALAETYKASRRILDVLGKDYPAVVARLKKFMPKEVLERELDKIATSTL